MALKTYTDLVGAVKWWSNNRDDVEDIAADCVRLCESHLNMDLRCSEMLTKVVLTPANGVVTLPDDFIGVYSVIENDSIPRVLSPLSEDIFQLTWGHAGAAPATNYSIVGNQLETGPPTSTDLILTYYQAIPSLEDNDTNWLMTKYPSIYLEGAQMEVYRALKMDKDLQISSGRFDAAINKLIESEDFVMMSSATPPASAGNVF